MRSAKIIRNIIYCVGLLIIYCMELFPFSEGATFISGIVCICTAALIHSLVSIFSKDESKDAKES